MEYQWTCPNCGEELEVTPQPVAIECDACGELLVFTDEHKLVLAEPLTTYFDADGGSNSAAGAQASEPAWQVGKFKLSVQRQTRADQLAQMRVIQERQAFRQGFISGLLVIILGGLLLLSIGAHIYFFESSWVDLAGVVVGGLFLALGLFIVIWFMRTMRPGAI